MHGVKLPVPSSNGQYEQQSYSSSERLDPKEYKGRNTCFKVTGTNLFWDTQKQFILACWVVGCILLNKLSASPGYNNCA